MHNISLTAKRFYEKGKADEDFVMESIINTIGGSVTKAKRKEDVNEHIDLWWKTPKNVLVGIDVKGLNKRKRSDTSFSNVHWLELQNVKGKDGWLKGKSDYIAFRTIDKIMFVKRHRLLEFALESIKNKEVVYDTPKECYVPYKRLKYGRDDLSLMALDDDLESIADFCIVCK